MTQEVKFGCDGSGGHKVYNQLHNVKTNNIIMVMFFPLKIVKPKILFESICCSNFGKSSQIFS